ASDSDIISYALKTLLKNIDPLLKPEPKVRKPSAAEARKASAAEVKAHLDSSTNLELKTTTANQKKSAKSLSISSNSKLRRIKLKQAQGRCTFKDPLTGRTCGSSYQVELDHIIPRALGGSDHP